jgi:hypothetical protein
MRVTDWYKNGCIDTFQEFCNQNQNKLISIKLANHSELVKGILHSFLIKPLEVAGVFILLTDVVLHPAFYSLYDIRSLHSLGSNSLILPDTLVSLECHAC